MQKNYIKLKWDEVKGNFAQQIVELKKIQFKEEGEYLEQSYLEV